MANPSLFNDPFTGSPRDFRRMLGYSVLFHAAVLVVLVIVSSSWAARPLVFPVYEVDLVSLPTPAAEKPREPESAEVAKKEPPVRKVEVPKTPPPKKPSAPKPAPPPKPMPPLAAVPPPAEPVEAEPEPVSPVVPDSSPTVKEAEGEMVQPRTPPDPLASIPAPDVHIQAQVEIPDFEYPYYLELIRRKIGKHWAPPRLNPGSEIREAVVEFQLFAKGNMTGIRISKSSGNAFFDQAALRAIYQANPLPPLPQGVEKETLKIKLQFVLGRKG